MRRLFLHTFTISIVKIAILFVTTYFLDLLLTFKFPPCLFYGTKETFVFMLVLRRLRKIYHEATSKGLKLCRYSNPVVPFAL